MMVAIKDLEMPKNCEGCKCTCDIWDGSTICVLGAKEIDWENRPDDCPLMEVE